MNRILIAAAVVIAGAASVARAGVGEEADAAALATATVRPSTALDDDAVRPLDRSRAPMPMIERDSVSPQPRAPARTRTADDEVVHPVDRSFRPVRTLDDDPLPPERRATTSDQGSAVTGQRARSGRGVTEDPAGRANESARPDREARSGP
jgi:hypothetical protein